MLDIGDKICYNRGLGKHLVCLTMARICVIIEGWHTQIPVIHAKKTPVKGESDSNFITLLGNYCGSRVNADARYSTQNIATTIGSTRSDNPCINPQSIEPFLVLNISVMVI